MKERPEAYADRMSKMIAAEYDRIRKERFRLHSQLERIESEIGELQKRCPHLHLAHHPRQIAEDDAWDECLDCGARI